MSMMRVSSLLLLAATCSCLYASVVSEGEDSCTCKVLMPNEKARNHFQCPPGERSININRNSYHQHDSEARGLTGGCLPEIEKK